MSRSTRPRRREAARRPARAAAPAGKEAAARKVAMVLLGVTVVLVFAYAATSLAALRWAALATALGTVAAAVYHFIERGRRSLELEAAFRRATEHLGQDEKPGEVQVSGPGLGEDGATPGRMVAEGDRWFLEVGRERIEYELDDPGALTAWPDHRLADFAGQLARRRRLTLRCCGTCAHFGHSRVSRLASAGWVGYCTLSGQGTLEPERDAVHIWHVCRRWEQRSIV